MIISHPKLLKGRNKTKYLTRTSIKLKFVKTSMVKPVETLRYIKDNSSSSSRPIKSPGKFEDLKLYWKSDKRPYFSRVSTSLLFVRLSKTLLTKEKRTIRTVVLSHWTFPGTFKYRDHR